MPNNNSLHIEHVVEKVVENGEILKDVDYSTVRHGPNQFVVQGYNRNVPFILTNMSPQALQKVYKQGSIASKAILNKQGSIASKAILNKQGSIAKEAKNQNRTAKVKRLKNKTRSKRKK